MEFLLPWEKYSFSIKKMIKSGVITEKAVRYFWKDSCYDVVLPIRAVPSVSMVKNPVLWKQEIRDHHEHKLYTKGGLCGRIHDDSSAQLNGLSIKSVLIQICDLVLSRKRGTAAVGSVNGLLSVCVHGEQKDRKRNWMIRAEHISQHLPSREDCVHTKRSPREHTIVGRYWDGNGSHMI